MTLRWRIYYGDGSTWSNLDGPPELAPCRNVQVIVAMYEGKRILLYGGVTGVATESAIDPNRLGYYWYENDGWVIGDYLGWLDYQMRPGFKITKFGRSILTPDFHAIMARAHADPDFPWPPQE